MVDIPLGLSQALESGDRVNGSLDSPTEASGPLADDLANVFTNDLRRPQRRAKDFQAVATIKYCSTVRVTIRTD